jgi:hypothetical protein
MNTDITPANSVCPVYLEPISEEQAKADQAEIATREKAEADKAKLKAATIAKLGLTADEVAALLS